MKYVRQNQKGFTLIEVLIVVAIIGILTAILVANYNDARKNSRDKIRKSDLKTIQLSLELYKAQVGSYPSALTSLAPTYVATVPTDPASKSSYLYTSNGTSYKVRTDSVESQLVTSFSDEFARCPSQIGSCTSLSAIANTYAVYSAGAEGW
jgi:prepilin-type N-terminal cleavage/methylation domain-containing protein